MHSHEKKRKWGYLHFKNFFSPAVMNASTFLPLHACKLELYKVMFLEIESNHDEFNDGGRDTP
jgi:hypothetical protein